MQTSERLEFHPLADLFPLISDDEQNELADSIKFHGLIHPIMLFEEKILDGRHRYQACLEVDVEPVFTEFKGDDPLTFVISTNFHRRHLSASQRAMIAAKMETMTPWLPKKPKTVEISKPSQLPIKIKELSPNNQAPVSEPNSVAVRPIPVSRNMAASAMNVSKRSVTRASVVLAESPIMADEVVSGKLTVTEAVRNIAKQKADPVALDKEGFPIPPKILPLWKHAEEEAKAALQLVSKLRSMIKLAGESGDIAYRELRHAETVSLLTNLFGNFKLVLPHGVCTVCQGKLPDTCTLCRGRGFLSGFAYQMFGSDEVKKIREKIKEASK